MTRAATVKAAMAALRVEGLANTGMDDIVHRGVHEEVGVSRECSTNAYVCCH